MQAENRRVIVAALCANLGISLAKFAGFLATGAASMLAEAAHSIADSGNQALLLWGGASSRRAPTREHPFGYGRERYFWAFVVAVVLFSLGSVFAVYQGVEKFLRPHVLEQPVWALGILGVAIVLEGLSFRIAAREARAQKIESSWWRFIRDSKNPELPVVLLEDLGAVLGLGFALVGIGLAIGLDEPRFDALGSVAIGLLLGVIAIVLAIEMKSLLIGEAAAPQSIDRIHAALLAGDELRRVIHLRTLHLGPDELLVVCKAEFARSLSLAEVSAAVDAAEARVRDAVPIAKVIYIEPDLFDSRRS